MVDKSSSSSLAVLYDAGRGLVQLEITPIQPLNTTRSCMGSGSSVTPGSTRSFLCASRQTCYEVEFQDFINSRVDGLICRVQDLEKFISIKFFD